MKDVEEEVRLHCPKCYGDHWGGSPKRFCHGSDTQVSCGTSWNSEDDWKLAEGYRTFSFDSKEEYEEYLRRIE